MIQRMFILALGMVFLGCQTLPDSKESAQTFLNHLQNQNYETLSKYMSPDNFKVLEPYKKASVTLGAFTLTQGFTVIENKEQKDQTGKIAVSFQIGTGTTTQTLIMTKNKDQWEYEIPKDLLPNLVPLKVVGQLFLDYMTDFDMDSAASLSTEEGAAMLKGMKGMLSMIPKDQIGKEAKRAKVTEEKINGETAVLTYTEEGSDTPKTIALKQVQGIWKVDFKKDLGL